MTADWKRTSVWALLATIVFSYMHIGDELWSRWDFGAAQVTSSTDAAILGVLPLVVGLWALVWILQDRSWGSVVGLVFGLFVTYASSTHVTELGELTGFRTGVVALMFLSAVTLVAVSARMTWAQKPWSRSSASGA